jgi:class 3 adenylate cyclase
MTCPSCRAQQPEGRKFCTECGGSLAAVCPNCAAPTEPGAKFCGECGHSLEPAGDSAVVIPDVAGDPGRQRFVTVLFADLVGFTPFSESRDSEDVRAMLTTYFDRARDIVERFGGTVDKFIGDAVMAIWGAETTSEDDAERGVRAALDLLDAVAALGEEIGAGDLSARIGVMSGTTSVGSGGNERGFVVGDLVNTASRLQAAADAGTVLVGRATQEVTGAAIDYSPPVTLQVKGKEAPVEAWQALRVAAGRGGEGKAQGLTPPFVGRDHDMRLLKDLLHATTREGRARLVSIIGQPGIGKTRLVQEFENYIDGLSEDVYWHTGRSPAYGDGVTYWALGEMIRRRCRIAETDDDHRSRTKLLTALTEYVPDADDRTWLEPRIAGLLGLGEVPDIDRSELFGAWRMFFERVAARGTVVMVFEDLHWADDGLLDFVEQLIHRSSQFPILMISLARPDLLERRSGWAVGAANALAMQLAPLADVAIEELVLGMVPGAPPEVSEAIVPRAAGIPLYAVEFVRMLVNRGRLLEEHGAWRLADSMGEVEVPDSLVGVVGARIDQLPTSSRVVLENASVLGHSFTADGLEQLTGLDAEETQVQLHDLVQRSVLEVDIDPRSPERGQYRFVQSLIREVALSRLTKQDRLTKHLAVAQYLEGLNIPELTPVAASHYLSAIEASSNEAEAAELATSAVEALLAAAERAASLQSHQQALTLVASALEIEPAPALRGRLLILSANARTALLDYDGVEDAVTAEATFAAIGDIDGRLRALAAGMRIYAITTRAIEGEAWAKPRLDGIGAVESVSNARALSALGRCMGLARAANPAEFGPALAYMDRALALAEKLDAVSVIAEALDSKGTSFAMMGRNREGMALLLASHQLAIEHDFGQEYQRALNNMSYLSAADSPRQTLEINEERIISARRAGDPRLLLDALLNQAFTLNEEGLWEAARALLEEVDYDGIPRPDQIGFDTVLAEQSAVRGGAAAAEETLRLGEAEYLDIVDTVDPQIADWYAGQRAKHAFLNGRLEEAYEKSIDLADTSPNLFDVRTALPAAMLLNDREKLERVGAVLQQTTYRGRSIDWLNLMVEGAIAAAVGRMDVAARAFDDVSTRMEGHEFFIRAATQRALMASMLGTDHAVGHDLARRAYDELSSVGATTIIDVVSNGVLAPDADQRELA